MDTTMKVTGKAGILTTAQQDALERGYNLKDAAELLTGYLVQRGISDEHLGNLINLVSRSGDAFEEAWNGAYCEHEAAEEAAQGRPAKLRAVRQ